MRHVGFCIALTALVTVSVELASAAPATCQTEWIPGQLPITAEGDFPAAAREHPITVRLGERLEVRVESDEFDTVLELLSPTGRKLSNDDADGTTNSRISTFVLTEGVWCARVTAFDERTGGAYRIGISRGPEGRVHLFTPGELQETDSISPKGFRFRSHGHRLEQNSELFAELVADGFEPSLILIGPDGSRYSSEYVFTESLTNVTLPFAGAGTWHLIVTHQEILPATGQYQLVLVEVPLSVNRRSLTDSLTLQSPQLLHGEFYRTHPFDLPASATIVFELSSNSFDPFLAVRSPSGTWYRDDDGGLGNDARLELTGEEGRWEVIVTSFRSGETGAYRLTVTR